MIGTINNRNKLIHVFTQTPSILSKNEFRTFWIKTTATTISVGRGGVTAPFMIYSLEKSNPRINYVAFSSWGPHSGQWKILPNGIRFATNGYNFKYYTKSTVTDLQASVHLSSECREQANDKKKHLLKPMRKIQHFLIVAFEFHLKSTSDGTILLSPCDGCDGYEVVIGGWDNTQSVIRDKKGQPHPGHAVTQVGCNNCD